MGRPRGFDETEVVRAAAALFARQAYDGVSVDDLVAHLGVHRNSLYKTFGSKRGLYMAALRWHVDNELLPLVTAVGEAPDLPGAVRRALAVRDGGSPLDLLLMAAAERAPVDAEVAAQVARALNALEETLATRLPGASPAPGLAPALASALLGLRLRARTTQPDPGTAPPEPHTAPPGPGTTPSRTGTAPSEPGTAPPGTSNAESGTGTAFPGFVDAEQAAVVLANYFNSTNTDISR
ncbi:TetR family transcriptional regulator [Nonomuraea pusilla]|uniref:TetR/AcrR family transcriptional regulator n=1 Tax=Nonomuraea pusilla TaxID=46177 RepID=UPI0033209C2A